MTTPAPDDLSLRTMLDSTLKDFGVNAAPPQPATPEAPQGDIKQLPFDRRTQALIAIGALLVIGIIAYVLGSRQPTAAPEARPTAVATVAATPAPTAAPATPVRLLAAFAAPDGVTLGTIEATRPYTVTAHYGEEWIQAQVEGSGLIWLRAVDLPGVELAGTDLAPPTPRPAPAPAVRPASAPAATPAPCTQDIAPYVVSRRVLLGTLPIGEVSGWSCTSAADAEAAAQVQEEQVRASYQATVTTKTSEATR